MPPSRHVGLLCIYIYEDKICVYNISKINNFISNKECISSPCPVTSYYMISKKDRASGTEMI